ncbi:hypothetical protein [uncultured Sphingomonas sp.]|uniref:hypothetical protein n=1 Tax=uncultured Sphingomonas sp. TaxID=158754 RepID=UPI0025D93EA1|nr:hypothetical protein [uncultured Sphingomonas sp.]
MTYATENNHRGIDTSREAAEMVAPMSNRLRAIVHGILFDHPKGLTVDETCHLAGFPRYSLQPRFTELRKLGSIRDTGERRFNESGARAIVWRATVLDRMEAQAGSVRAFEDQRLRDARRAEWERTKGEGFEAPGSACVASRAKREGDAL